MVGKLGKLLSVSVCQDSCIWHVEHLDKMRSIELLLCPQLLFSWAHGLEVDLGEGASSRQVPSARLSSGCSCVWQAVGRWRVMACWEWSEQWTFMATFELNTTEHIFVAVCDLAVDYINRCTCPFNLQVATQLAPEDLHDLLKPVQLSLALSILPCLAKKVKTVGFWQL